MNADNLDGLAKAKIQETDGTHEPDIAIGSREHIFHLLAEAAEIEHTLMCSYLYAAFSLKRDDPSCGDRQTKAIKRWHSAILGVAIEEMSHLLIVSNLTVALGGRPHFTRPNFPVSSGYFPADVVLRLTPFSMDTLDHFIFIERPTGVEKQDGDGFESVPHAREQAYQGLMPSTQDYTTVSHLYEAIRSNLTAFVDRVGSKTLFIGPPGSQIGPEIVKMPGVECITDLDSALLAIDRIVEQGEGSPCDRKDSHYRKFQKIKKEYQTLLKADPDFSPAYPVATNPVMRRPPEPEDKVFIEEKPAAMVLDFANAAYGLLLRFLVQSYHKSGTQHEEKRQLLNASIEMMHVLDTAGRALVKLPASSEHPDINAGITFTMLRGVEPLVGGIVEKTLIVERLVQLTAGAKKIARSISEIQPIVLKLEKLTEKFSTP